MSTFEKVDTDIVYDGFSRVARERFRHADGTEVEREHVRHADAVAVVAVDGDDVVLVRQPRHAVGEPALLEIPAGKLDVEGESPEQAARRELSEEIGMRAGSLTLLHRYYVSAGWTDEEVHLYLAEALTPDPAAHAVDDEERITVERRPLAQLGAVIDGCKDSKTLIGLLALQRRLHAAG